MKTYRCTITARVHNSRIHLKIVAKVATMGARMAQGASMKSMSAKDAKNGFGLLLDTARAEPVTIEKHGRAVVVVVSVEEYSRLKTRQPSESAPRGTQERTRRSKI